MAFFPPPADWRQDIHRVLSSSRIVDITTAASRAHHRAPPLPADREHLTAARDMLITLLGQDTVVHTTAATRLASVSPSELMSSVRLDSPEAVQAIERLAAAVGAHLDGRDDQATLEAMGRLRDVFANVARYSHQNDVRRASSSSSSAWPSPTSLSS